MPAHTSLARARKLRHPARWCRRPNLDFGRSWRRPFPKAAKPRVVAGNDQAGEHKRNGKNRSARRVADGGRTARGHERAILAAPGHRRLIRAAWHVGWHRHRCLIAHAGRQGRCRRGDRGENQPGDGQRSKQIADGGQAFHALPIAQPDRPEKPAPTQARDRLRERRASPFRARRPMRNKRRSGKSASIAARAVMLNPERGSSGTNETVGILNRSLQYLLCRRDGLAAYEFRCHDP